MPLPGKTLLSATRIQKRVRELGLSIRRHYQGKNLTVIGLMDGSLFFLADLLRHLPPETHIECWRLKSYVGRQSTGKIEGLQSCSGMYSGRHVLIVDDILDSGLTLSQARDHIRSQDAEDIKLCVLLDKKVPRTHQVEPHWTGFEIPNLFVIGYGLDLNHQYRTLRMIRSLED
ncbi:MAG: hypoxanthine phosphoribosyltransferase [Blastochloris sp.]|nr:hypoxanthine phosphoribosyltransferase [Blastochloris sp.]